MPDLANCDYVDRINRAIDHITRELAGPLRLEDVAAVACFSPFHFHRVFRALVGETLHAFVKRVRLERALYLMCHRDGASLTDIALGCGFSSSSDFSRSFRGQYGAAPRSFDLERFRQERRARGLGAPRPEEHRLAGLPAGAADGFEVRLREAPARRVAYVRVFRPYEGERVSAAAARMVAWARARGLAGGQWLGMQWDDPEIVALERCRYDVGLVVPEDAAVDGEVSVMVLPAMTLAEIEIAGSVALEMRAIEWLYTSWLPRSGLVPDHQPSFEAWDGEPFAHGYEHFALRLQLAVIAAGAAL